MWDECISRQFLWRWGCYSGEITHFLMGMRYFTPIFGDGGCYLWRDNTFLMGDECISRQSFGDGGCYSGEITHFLMGMRELNPA